MIHVGTAGRLLVCEGCAARPPDLPTVTDDLGTLTRVVEVLDEVALDYLSACPWCGSAADARRRVVVVRLAGDESQAKARGLALEHAQALDERGKRVALAERTTP